MKIEKIDELSLAFREKDRIHAVDDPIREDLSALARAGDTLFLSCDETAGVEALDPDGSGGWADHDHISLSRFFDLPDGADGEADLEGLAVEDGWLWAVGSHSLKRGKPLDGAPGAAALKRLRKVKRDPNRFFLGRAPLRRMGEGRYLPVAHDGSRRAQAVEMKRKSSRLKDWLAKDPLLAPFLDLPSKENGFDIEGVAARGDRVWLGLRGPVLRGCAVLVELDMKVTGDGHLKPRKRRGGLRHRLRLLPSMGLGVRDLSFDGDDMIVLLGPATAASGVAAALIWRDAAHDGAEGLVDPARTLGPAPLAAGWGQDNPEGLIPWAEAGEGAYLVVHDDPAPWRLHDDGRRFTADIVRIVRD